MEDGSAKHYCIVGLITKYFLLLPCDARQGGEKAGRRKINAKSHKRNEEKLVVARCTSFIIIVPFTPQDHCLSSIKGKLDDVQLCETQI